MRARGIVRALGAAPIAIACVVIGGVPTVALALSGAPSQHTAAAVMARVATVKRPTRRMRRRLKHKSVVARKLVDRASRCNRSR